MLSSICQRSLLLSFLIVSTAAPLWAESPRHLKACIAVHCVSGDADTIRISRASDGQHMETIDVSGEVQHVSILDGYFVVITESTGYLITSEIELLHRRQVGFSPTNIVTVPGARILHQPGGLLREWTVQGGQLQSRGLEVPLVGELVFQARDQHGDHFLFTDRWLTPEQTIHTVHVLGSNSEYAWFLADERFAQPGRLMRVNRSAQWEEVSHYPLEAFYQAESSLGAIRALDWPQRLAMVRALHSAHLRERPIAQMIMDSAADTPPQRIQSITALVMDGFDGEPIEALAKVFSKWGRESRRSAVLGANSHALKAEAMALFVRFQLTQTQPRMLAIADAQLFLQSLSRMHQEQRAHVVGVLQEQARSLHTASRDYLIREAEQPAVVAALLPAAVTALRENADSRDIDELLVQLDRLSIPHGPTIHALAERYPHFQEPVRRHVLERMAQRGHTGRFIYMYVDAVDSLRNEQAMSFVLSYLKQLSDNERSNILARLRSRDDFDIERFRIQGNIVHPAIQDWPERFALSAEYRHVLHHVGPLTLHTRATRDGEHNRVSIHIVAPGRESLLQASLDGRCTESARYREEGRYIRWRLLLPVANVTAEYEVVEYLCAINPEAVQAFERLREKLIYHGVELTGATELREQRTVRTRDHVRDLHVELTSFGQSLQREAQAPSHCRASRDNCMAVCEGLSDRDGGFLSQSTRGRCQSRCHDGFYHCTEQAR